MYGSDIFWISCSSFSWPPPHLFQADIARQQSGAKHHRSAGPYSTAVDSWKQNSTAFYTLSGNIPTIFLIHLGHSCYILSTLEVHSKHSNCILFEFLAVASLGWVSPGAATEGVTAIFFLKKTDDFLVITVCQFCGVTRIYFLLKNWQPFLPIIVTLIDFTGVSPTAGCHPGPFYLSELVFPLFSFSINLPTKIFSCRCHPKRSAQAPSPLVTPLILGRSNRIQQPFREHFDCTRTSFETPCN